MATKRISQLIQASPEINEAYDTSTSGFAQFSAEVAHWFNGQQHSFAELDDEAKKYPENVAFRTALKIVASKRIISGIDQKVAVTLLNLVYKETGRMQPHVACTRMVTTPSVSKSKPCRNLKP